LEYRFDVNKGQAVNAKNRKMKILDLIDLGTEEKDEQMLLRDV